MEGQPMAKEILVLRSITYAYKAQRVLDKAGIRSMILRTPEEYAPRGCSYSLSVSGGGERAAELLHRNGIQVLNRIRTP